MPRGLLRQTFAGPLSVCGSLASAHGDSPAGAGLGVWLSGALDSETAPDGADPMARCQPVYPSSAGAKLMLVYLALTAALKALTTCCQRTVLSGSMRTGVSAG